MIDAHILWRHNKVYMRKRCPDHGQFETLIYAALAEIVKQARTKLLGAEPLVNLKKIGLPPGLDFTQAKSMARHASAAVKEGKLGYALLVGSKPGGKTGNDDLLITGHE